MKTEDFTLNIKILKYEMTYLTQIGLKNYRK